MPLSEDRRAALNETKLAALIAGGGVATAPSWSATSGTSAMALVESCLHVYLAEPSRRDLGAVMVRVASHAASAATVYVDDNPEFEAAVGTLARRAAYYTPDVRVVVVTGRDTAPAVPSSFDPALDVDPAAAALSSTLIDAGLDIIVEHGMLKGEVLGLEVARIVTDDTAAAGARVEVGIGRFDREIAQMMHGEHVTVDHVVAAADLVRAHRYPGAPIHPLRDLMPERWMRAAVLADPSIIGCVQAVPMDGSVSPANLRDRQAAMIVGSRNGERDGGGDICVGVTAGVDLDAVAEAADSRSRAGLTGEFAMVVTTGDLLPTVSAAAELLREPPTFVSHTAPW